MFQIYIYKKNLYNIGRIFQNPYLCRIIIFYYNLYSINKYNSLYANTSYNSHVCFIFGPQPKYRGLEGYRQTITALYQ